MSSFFSSLIGHNFQVEQLKKLLANNALPHALLFTGPVAVGKFSLARLLAKAILVRDENDKNSAKLFDAGNHPDLHLVGLEEGKKDIAVDDIRELTNTLQLKPYYSTASVAIINDAHRMNASSSNALLKTLEEPTPHGRLILITDTPHRLLPTIISRCQNICFGGLTEDQITNILKQLCTETALNEKAFTKLLSLTNQSLYPLGLDRFINPRTGNVSDKKVLEENLVQLIKLSTEFTETISRILDQSGIKDVLLAVTKLSENKDSSYLVWHILKQQIRKRLRSSDKNEASRWGSLLEETIKAEQLSNERNANMCLQMGSALLSF